MIFDNSELLRAFPVALREEALKVISVLPETSLSAYSFYVDIGEDTVSIPYRIYHDPATIESAGLSQTQCDLLACLLTRHHSGFVREEYLGKILCSDREWVPPFVVQLVGEYVIEIIGKIDNGTRQLNPDLYRTFLKRNSRFYKTTKRRVQSYWDCYHRGERKEDYAGFQVLAFFDKLMTDSL